MGDFNKNKADINGKIPVEQRDEKSCALKPKLARSSSLHTNRREMLQNLFTKLEITIRQVGFNGNNNIDAQTIYLYLLRYVLN